MEFFHNFTAPLWELFAGNALLLLCSICYLIWWVIAFRPDSGGGAGGGGIFLAFAFLTGISAMILMSASIRTLSKDSKALSVTFILLGAAFLYVILLLITALVFHRQVTSELLIIHVWAAVELCTIWVLYGTGRFAIGRTAVLATLVGLATVASLICYLLYYRLDGIASYRNGMVPLGTDAVVMAVILGVLAVS